MLPDNCFFPGDGNTTAGDAGSTDQKGSGDDGVGVAEVEEDSQDTPEDIPEEDDSSLSQQAAGDTSSAPRADIRDIIAATVQVCLSVFSTLPHGDDQLFDVPL